MRFQLANTADQMWHREGGQVSWGFGFEVANYSEEEDNGEEMVLVPDGWSVTIMLGRWAFVISSEAGFSGRIWRRCEALRALLGGAVKWRNHDGTIRSHSPDHHGHTQTGQPVWHRSEDCLAGFAPGWARVPSMSGWLNDKELKGFGEDHHGGLDHHHET